MVYRQAVKPQTTQRSSKFAIIWLHFTASRNGALRWQHQTKTTKPHYSGFVVIHQDQIIIGSAPVLIRPLGQLPMPDNTEQTQQHPICVPGFLLCQ